MSDSRTLTYEELPVCIARFYNPDDIKLIRVSDFPASEDNPATTVMVIKVVPLRPTPQMPEGVRRWQKVGDGAWEFTG